MLAPGRHSATCEASPNIALIKYWGQRIPEYNVPYNASLSVTLDGLCTRTRVTFDPALDRDTLEINGAPASPREVEDVRRFLDLFRARKRRPWHAHVESRNNFPTASGMASSASGFAALAGAAAAALGLQGRLRELSRYARRGSGSAARSVYGGFVIWRAGCHWDGEDSYALPFLGPEYWPEFRDVVCLVAHAPTKTIRSQEAMQRSVETSPKFAERQKAVHRRRLRMQKALIDRDPERLFPLIMEECDSFREVCETTDPPLDYLTDVSRSILEEVGALNREAGRSLAAYTHDAGAHVHVFTTARHARAIAARLGALRGVEETRILRPGRGLRWIPSRDQRTRRSNSGGGSSSPIEATSGVTSRM